CGSRARSRSCCPRSFSSYTPSHRRAMRVWTCNAPDPTQDARWDLGPIADCEREQHGVSEPRTAGGTSAGMSAQWWRHALRLILALALLTPAVASAQSTAQRGVPEEERVAQRSEERRVGKECRELWARYRIK